MTIIDKPIVTSRLDTDFYKFTMGQLVFRKYPDIPVVYEFKNRSRYPLARNISLGRLREELEALRGLTLREGEYQYLQGLNDGMFGQDFLEHLRGLKLPEFELERVGDDIRLRFHGLWKDAIYWETPALAIVNELYCESLLGKLNPFDKINTIAIGRIRLYEKNRLLERHPGAVCSEFGTRRRAFGWWQDYVVSILKRGLPPSQFTGTSNVELAMKHQLNPIGTLAHQMFMAMSGIMHGSDEEVLASHNTVLRDWWQMYGYRLSIALTDTYGTDFFFRDMSFEQAKNWKGLRQDSGDPIEFGEKAIDFYESHGIDPRTKLIVFSDGLDVEAIIKIADHFSGRINTTFGWGTNLTNDIGFKPLSIVIKLVESCGHGTVKLSDNLAKATGKPEDIERFKKIFGYAREFKEACVY